MDDSVPIEVRAEVAMTDPTTRTRTIEEALRQGLQAEHVAIVDESARHSGHSGAESGGGHYQILVVSERFRGVSRVAAQRLVYAALGDLMVHDIHALSMRTLTPEEWSGQG
jgi:BolA protein